MSHFTTTKELCSLPDGHPCECYSCEDLAEQEAEQSGYEDHKQNHSWGDSLDDSELADFYSRGWAKAQRERQSA